MNNNELLNVICNKTILFVKLTSSWDKTSGMYPFKVFDTIEECEKFINKHLDDNTDIIEKFHVEPPHSVIDEDNDYEESIETEYGIKFHYVRNSWVVMKNGVIVEDRPWQKCKTGIVQWFEKHTDFREATETFRESMIRIDERGCKCFNWVKTDVDRR